MVCEGLNISSLFSFNLTQNNITKWKIHENYYANCQLLKAMYTTFRELVLFSPVFVMIKLPDFVVVSFGLIAAVSMKIAVIMLCNLVEVDYMFVFRCVSRERKQ
jgi:hypothetical protein